MMLLDSSRVGGQSLLLVFHGGAQEAEVTLPARGDGAAYHLVWNSAWERPLASADSEATEATEDPGEGRPLTVTAASVRIYSLVP
jgi:glycogen operon protein